MTLAMKKFFCLFCVFAALFSVNAGIVTTNLLGLATFSAGNNTNATFVVPGTHSLNPHTITLYHSATNIIFPTTNYAEITFDGGQTWAVYSTFVDSTNNQTEQWTPPTSSMVYSNRVRSVTSTNQTLLNQANWIQ